MQRTREIPREGWAAYLAGLSRHEHGHRVRIELESEGLGAQHFAEQMPLRDIRWEARGSEAGAICVQVGRDDEELTHWIGAPTRVYAEESDDGELGCLDIEAEPQGKTLIFFEPAEAEPWMH
ncbi:hypothetical protein FGE12_12075 [Aggregicoccus sp. 17bor-14]|uniref:DUF5335 family protein n=1 Tax=Myxococcaceae TaxID=31 RepID=UPI00129C1AF3|nr:MULTISPECIES: DUF5335 family protein [Myxococcaceae]MBF5043126.1 DUF5335 family protein [Simulacricoccus sp. 17bor-14]MRI88887.1 hypothetical protein [Aggregicoccus sp. 17bor-14]